MQFDWFYLVPLVAIVGGITYGIFGLYFKSRRQETAGKGSPDLQAALARSNELNLRLLEKLDSMDTRLKGIERTLNEVG